MSSPHPEPYDVARPQKALQQLTAAIEARGFSAGPFHPETILCVAHDRHTAGYCFQVGLFTDLVGQRDWYLRTWPPVFYRVPANVSVLNVCLAVLRVGYYGGTLLPDTIVEHYQLQEITASSFQDSFGFH